MNHLWQVRRPSPRCEVESILRLLVVWLLSLATGTVQAAGGGRRVDPESVLPIRELAPDRQAEVAEVIRDATLHRRGQPETFPCNPKTYLALLGDPLLTLGLWSDLSPTPAQLRQTGPVTYEGHDGGGTGATWEYLVRSPRLHAMFCNLDYTTPRRNARLQGRIVLIVRSGFFREVDGELWVQHDVEAFVKIDSRGWKAVAATLRPLVEKVLEDQVQEAGLFVSLMARTVESYPDWAAGVVSQNPGMRPESRDEFLQLLTQTRRPTASPGRPRLVAESAPPEGRTLTGR